MHATEAHARGRGRLWRLFWIGAAVILGVAAAIAISAVLSGAFSERDGKILLTLAALFFAGSTALAGLALLERGQLGQLGAVIVAASPIGFALIVTAFWIERPIDALDRSASTAFLLLLAGLLTATGRLLAESPRSNTAFLGTAVALAIAEAITLSAVWRTNPGSGTAKAAATFWILTALGYFLTPILRRLEPAPTGATRTVAALDDVDVIATRQPGPADVIVTADRSRLVVSGPAGRVALERGESVVVRRARAPDRAATPGSSRTKM